MRSSSPTAPSRILSRVAAAALLAGLAAGCSDTSRFTADPFSNPFNSQPTQTASIPAYPTPKVQTQTLAPVGGYSSRPIAAQPLPAVGSVGTMPAAHSPQPNYSANTSGRSAINTGSIGNSPRVSGFSKGGWSAEGGTVVVARNGDSAETLSNRYGVPAEAIMATNGLSSAYLAPGQQVTIPTYSLKNAVVQPRPAVPSIAPRPKPAAAAHPTAPVPVRVTAAQPVPPKAVAGAGADLHIVRPGETLTSIAQDYGTTRQSLAKANGLDEWTSVRIGQKLKVSGASSEKQASLQAKPLGTLRGKTQTEPSPATAKSVRTVEVKPVTTKSTRVASVEPATVAKVDKMKLSAPKSVASKPVEQQSEQVEDTASLPEKPASAGQAQDQTAEASEDDAPQFRWPVRGRVIQAFGQNSDGINISVPEGTEVKAAEGGVVAYAGNELKGYGNLVLIRHPNGFVTAYAHTKDIEVKRGDTVKRGQTIATAGQTGNVTSPQLLFELRKGATPVDPRRYLGT